MTCAQGAEWNGFRPAHAETERRIQRQAVRQRTGLRAKGIVEVRRPDDLVERVSLLAGRPALPVIQVDQICAGLDVMPFQLGDAGRIVKECRRVVGCGDKCIAACDRIGALVQQTNSYAGGWSRKQESQ